ncbi:MAG: hypothetical protein QOF78_673 [Phycisphaerales bacterium]|jgi:hypothetical protein|nr:hypothetical protein [Phycisphaerales bacterium]
MRDRVPLRSRSCCTSWIEPLERRLLRTVISGTAGDDTISLYGFWSSLGVTINGVQTSLPLTETAQFTINTGAGNDTVTINVWSQAQFDGDFDTQDDLTIEHGYVTLDSGQSLGALALNNVGSFASVTGNDGCLYLTSLSIFGGVLDLNDNDIVVDYSGASPVNTIAGYVSTGFQQTGDFFAPVLYVVATDTGGPAPRALEYNTETEQWEWSSDPNTLIYKDAVNEQWVLVWWDDFQYWNQFYVAPLSGHDYPPTDADAWSFDHAELAPGGEGTPARTGVLVAVVPEPGWGIISSAGRQSTSPSGHIHAVFDNAANEAGFTEWPEGSNVSISANAVIGKFTYRGDANLDGLVSGDDYSSLDFHALDTNIASAVAWLYGDFNRNGVIDQSDYDIIDAYFA